MEPPQEEQFSASSSASPVAIIASVGTAPSSYLTVPIAVPSGPLLLLPGPRTPKQESLDLLLLPEDNLSSDSIPLTLEPLQQPSPAPSGTPPAPLPSPIPLSDRVYMSVYSSSSADTDLSEFSNPPARRYRMPDPPKMSRKISMVCVHSAMTACVSKTSLLTIPSPRRSNTSELYKHIRSAHW